MKKITSLLLAIFLLLQSALVFAETTSYPYDTVGYFVEKAEFVGDSQIEATITYTSHYGSTANFHTVSYLAVYNNETGKLLEVASQNVDLLKPFQYVGRVTLKQTINVSKTAANVFSVKAIMIEGLTSLRPNCPVPYMANEIIITTANARVPLVTADTVIEEYNFDKTQSYIDLRYTDISEASRLEGWYIGFGADYGSYALGTHVLKGDVDIKDYIGYSCVVEIDVSNKSQPKLHSISKKAGKNIEVVIDPSLFVDTNITANGYATYYKTAADTKTSKLQLENLTIYNNLTKTSDTQLISYSGDISYKFVDTDANGKYDSVFITNEKSFVIGSVNTTTNKIFRDTTSPNAMCTNGVPAILTLDPLDDTVSWSIKDANGNNLTLSAVKAGQVVNIKVSQDDTYTLYDILITDTKIEGMITEVYSESKKIGTGTDTYYTIGDKSYRTMSDTTLSPGNTIIATLNNQGKIINYADASTINYGVVTGVDVEISFGTTAQVQMMKQNGTIVTLNLAKSITINGVYKNIASAYPNISALKSDIDQGDLFIYEINSANEIKTIYTTTSAIQMKYSTMKFVDFNSYPLSYNATAGKLGANYLLEGSLIYAVKTYALTDKSDLILANKAILTDEDMYNGTAIVKDGEIQAVVLLGVNYTAKSDSFPLVVTGVSTTTVDGDSRIKLNGLVNGVEKEYIGEQDIILDDIQVNDIIQLALNQNSEIANYTKLVDYTPAAFTATDNGNLGGIAIDDNKDFVNGKTVSLNLATAVVPATIAPNAVYTVGNNMPPIKGFAACGRAYELIGNVLRLINKTYDNTCGTNGTKDYSDGSTVEGDISDFLIDSSTVAYVYNGISKTIKATTIADLETDKLTGDYATTGRENDDLVYVYKYDGNTYMTLIIDTAGDSDMSLVAPTYLPDGDYTFSVGSVNKTANKLYRNVESPNAQTNLTTAMVYLAPAITAIKDDTGTTKTINDISPLDIINLSVTTVNGNKKYNVVVNKKIVTGVVTEKVGNSYMINGVGYSLFNTTLSLQVGVTYTIYLDKNNKIVDFNPILSANNYGVVTGVDVTTSFGATAQVQLMNQNGELNTLDIAKNVNVNGITISSSTFTSNGESLMNGTTSVISRGLVFIYELNSANEIKTIYTTTAGIQTKDYSMEFVDFKSSPLVYRGSYSKLGSNYVLDSSLVYAVRADQLYTNQDLILADKSLFTDEYAYSGTVIVKNGEIQAVVLFNTGYTVRADSYPLVVTGRSTVYIDGSLRTKLKGYVNGVLVEYVGELDFIDIDNININDVIQFRLNKNNEISILNKLVDYTPTAFTVMDNGNLGGYASDDNKYPIQSKSVMLNLAKAYNYYNPINPSAVYTIGSNADYINGFSASGRAYEIAGNTIRLINNFPATFTQYYTRNYGMNDQFITDFTINPNATAYKYSGATKTITPATIADLETDKSTNDCYTTSRDNDDLVYVYNYDGDTYMILIVDTEGDN